MAGTTITPMYYNFELLSKKHNHLELRSSFTEKALRKKWKNIRDQFMKEFKKNPVPRSGDAGTDQNTSMWPYFQIMLFIKDDITPELNEGNLDETTDGNYMNNNNDNERSPTPQSIAGSSASTQYTSTKRKCAQDLRQEFMELEKKKLDLLQIKLSQSSEKQEHDCEDLLFFKNLLPYMKELSPMQKLRTRNKITQVIMESLKTVSETDEEEDDDIEWSNSDEENDTL
ncbi:unnamed protein product [Arctia plantaginis]|uniref:BESS domain-containing protein n=1 Tax=Arctia plantaginis TaxID=874455 RepID=A0A8S0ZHF1_ARCPL|nr:unnamed protein product [Arctia plantaginis]CAB3231948.1 unnamed protein product [Arctia plantaginis]